MKTFKFTLLPIFLYVFSISVQAATIYADSNLDGNCSGNYNVTARACTGSDGNAYTTIQAAINAAAVGDTIYMRQGTYSEIAIDIPERLNGSAWTDGNFTTLMSYPGEWAKVDATGLREGGTRDIYDVAVFMHPKGFGTGEDRDFIEYWKFSNFEVTGGGPGFFLKVRHVKFYYLYIHDNGRSGVSDLQSGITSVNPQYAEIKYSYFKDNINAASPNLNMAHILFDSDYRDEDGSNGGTWIPEASTHHNEVAYNYFELTGGNLGDPHVAIRQKNQQRFGRNNRNPNDMAAVQDYGDKWHHNIVIGSKESIGASQDFIQIYNNITDSTINFGRFAGTTSDVPQVYNAVIYNNMVKNAASASYITASGYDSFYLNYYDDPSPKTVHEHVWFYNNIADGNVNDYHNVPFMLHWNMPENTSNPDTDNSDLVVERNLIYKNTNDVDLIVGRNHSNSYTGCEHRDHSVLEFNGCSNEWRGVADVINWKSSSSGLYIGNSGADQYKTNHAFALDGATTICSGGKSGNHPYLVGVALPGYIGAVNPNDNAWVSGVMFDVRSTTWLKDQAADAPAWIENTESQPGVCKAAPKPPTPSN